MKKENKQLEKEIENTLLEFWEYIVSMYLEDENIVDLGYVIHLLERKLSVWYIFIA